MRTQVEKADFTKAFKLRTKNWIIRTLNFCNTLPENTITELINSRLIKSAATSGIKYNAACKAESSKEFTIQINLAIEQVDQSLFWFEIIDNSGIPCDKLELIKLKSEISEILKVLSTARANTKV